jgi:methyl-accepting chemotaxis protein
VEAILSNALYADKLENYVIERLKEISKQKEVFEDLVAQVNLDLESEVKPFQKELNEVNDRMNEIDGQIENFIDAVGDSGNKAVTKLLEKKIENLQEDLKELKKIKGT